MEEEYEELEKATVKSVSMKWGLYVGLIMIAYGIILQVAGLATNQALSLLNYVFLIGIMVMAHKEFKENGDGFMSYSQGLGIGTLTTLIGGAISIVFSYVYVKFIDDSFLEQVKLQQIEQMEENGMSQQQIDAAMEMSAAFMTPEVMFPIAMVSMVVIGFIISLIVSAVTKNVNPEADI